ncbi:MAG TPA: FAD/NAD(P)-binding protein, partial [Terriglobales bacterium]|nr:FAD/NAD(P)-binding protein [Terriglobales bacterium]
MNDRELGMRREITRRDFLNGVALTLGAAIVPSHLFAAFDVQSDPEKLPDYYPPALTGLRGSHPGSFEAAHSLRDGTLWDEIGKPLDTGEVYDLIVVGGGISGLSAAHYFRKIAGPKSRILILDNHDDFGGHAKRNEFRSGNRMLLGYGGTFSVESPAPYSATAKAMVGELGIDVSSYPKYVSKDLYRSLGLAPAIFFDKETFGADKLVVNPVPHGGGEGADISQGDSAAWKKFMAEAPLSEKAKRDYDRLHHDKKDYLPGL